MRTYANDAAGWRAVDAALPPGLRGAPPREEHARLCGLDVHLDRHGDDAAPTRVVLLHGGGGHGRLLAPVGRRLAAMGAAAVAPDLPGYGLTAVPAARMRYELWVDVAAAVLAAEAERADRLVVAGFSMGGLLAVHAASALPEGTVDAVLVSTLLDPADPAARRAASRLPLPPPVLLAPLDRVRLPIRLVAPLSKMANDPAVCRAIARDPEGAGRSAPLGFWRSWLQYDRHPLAAFDRAPVTLAHPAADRWTPVGHSRRALARITRVPTREVLLPDGGHAPFEPAAIAALEDAFAGLL